MELSGGSSWAAEGLLCVPGRERKNFSEKGVGVRKGCGLFPLVEAFKVKIARGRKRNRVNFQEMKGKE